MTDTSELLARAKASLVGVTEGNWELEEGSKSCHCCFYQTVFARIGPGEFDYSIVCETMGNDGAFIAASRQNVPDLITALEASLARERALMDALANEVKRSRRHLAASTLALLDSKS